jgi:hypothetical protein
MYNQNETNFLDVLSWLDQWETLTQIHQYLELIFRIDGTETINKLTKGAAVVISTCRRGDTNNKSLSIVKEMMKYLRIDSLEKALRTRNIPKGFLLSMFMEKLIRNVAF